MPHLTNRIGLGSLLLMVTALAHAAPPCLGYEPTVEEMEEVLAAAQLDVSQPYYPEIEQACLFSGDNSAQMRYSVVWPPQRHAGTYSRLVRICETDLDEPHTRCRTATQEASLGAGRWFPIERQIGPFQLQEIVALIRPEMRYGEELGAIAFIQAPTANWSIDQHGYEITLKRTGISSQRALQLRYICAGEVDCQWQLTPR